LEGGALDKACNELQALVAGLQAPQQLSNDVGELFHKLPPRCSFSKKNKENI